MGDMSTKPAASSLNPEYADIVDTPSLREVTSREHKYCGHVLDVTVEKYLLSPHGPELTRDVVGMPGAVAVGVPSRARDPRTDPELMMDPTIYI